MPNELEWLKWRSIKTYLSDATNEKWWQEEKKNESPNEKRMRWTEREYTIDCCQNPLKEHSRFAISRYQDSKNEKNAMYGFHSTVGIFTNYIICIHAADEEMNV